MGQSVARASARYRVPAAIAPAAPDLGTLAHRLPIPVLAQHADPHEAGARTGYLLPEAIRAVGGRGSLVNHSEHPLALTLIAETVARLKSQGLVPVVCARDVRESRRLARLAPPYLAIEPPELIGGRISVSSARPELISGTVRAVRQISPRTQVLCGAGIHSTEDVATSVRLGAAGVLVASAVTGARDPARALDVLFRGFAGLRASVR